MTNVEISLANRINSLFDNWNAGHGRTLSNKELSTALTAAGRPVSTPYLSQLRSGKRASPSRGLLAALAEYFGVDLDYFFDEMTVSNDQDLDIARRLRDPRLRRLIRAAAELPLESQTYLAQIAELFRTAEGLAIRQQTFATHIRSSTAGLETVPTDLEHTAHVLRRSPHRLRSRRDRPIHSRGGSALHRRHHRSRP